MRKCTLLSWSLLCIVPWLIYTGCTDDGPDKSGSPSDGGDSSDPDQTGDTGTGGGMTGDGVLASFCNPLSLGNASVTIQLTLGEGTEAVTLSARTGTCSNRLGTPCIEVPTCPVVRAVLRDENGAELHSSQVEITEGMVYLFYTTVVSTSEIGLDNGTLSETLLCADMECIFRYSYNELTCAADDPCGWAGDDTCDSRCDEVLPGSAFDDSADCL
jgi:hypothetical protein